MYRGWQVVAVALCLAGAALSCSKGDRRSVVGQCRLYQECNGTVWLNRSCDAAYSFDSSSNTCNLAWNVDCYDAPRKCSKDGEKMEIPNSCRGYYECAGGQYLRKNCWFFQRFDTNTSSCQPFWKVNCSSHSVCSGSVNLPVKGKCAFYRTCVKGRYEEKSCLLPETVFDPVTNECVLKLLSKVNCTEDPPCDGAGKTAVSGECRKYTACADGRRETFSCPWMKRFDRVSGSCRWFFQVDCSAECAPGENAPSVNCSSYYSCVDGTFTLTSCGFGSYFDVATGSCLFLRGTCYKGECDLSSRKEVQGDCAGYAECVNGTYVRKSCPPFFRFDAEEGECRLAFLVTCDRGQSTCSGNWTKALSCREYQTCQDGKPINKSCGFFKSFNPRTEECDWPWLVNCTVPETCVNSTRKPYGNDCRKYYQCVRGVYTVQTCLFGNYFDNVNKTCVAQDKARCAGRSKREANLCREGETEVEPSSCSKYRQCDKGQWVTKSCSWLHRFNPADGQCHWSLKCFPNSGPSTTTPDGGSTSAGTSETPTSNIPDTPTTNIPDTPTSNIPDTPTTNNPDTPTTNNPDTPTTNNPDTPTSNIPDTSTTNTPNTPTSNTPNTPTPTPETSTTILCTPGDKKATGNSCVDFLLCDENGDWVLQTCSTWCKHFNGQKCVWAWQYPCIDPTTSTTPVPCADGEKKQDSDCKKYQECVSGKFVTKSCSWYEKFDPGSLQCKKTLWPFC